MYILIFSNQSINNLKNSKNAELWSPIPIDNLHNDSQNLSSKEHCRKGGRQVVRRRIREFAMWLCFPGKSKVSPTWLPKHELTKDDNSRHAKVDRKVQEASTLHKEWQATQKCWEGRNSLPQKDHNTWLSNTKWSVLKTFIQVTLYRLSSLCWGYICIYIYIYACNNY